MLKSCLKSAFIGVHRRPKIDLRPLRRSSTLDQFFSQLLQQHLISWSSPYGRSHWPVSAERKTASITAILRSASSSGTGGWPPSRMAREKRSPWIGYWSQGGDSCP